MEQWVEAFGVGFATGLLCAVLAYVVGTMNERANRRKRAEQAAWERRN